MAIKKKVVLLGDPSVGKTSLVRRFVLDEFSDSYITTIGTKVTKREVDIKTPLGEATINLVIWDVVGQHGFGAVQSSAYVGAEGATMVADLTRPDTLESIEKYWIPALYRVTGKIPLVFVANKCDLDARGFSMDSLRAVASRYKPTEEGNMRWPIPCFMTSAKTGENVDRTFRVLSLFFLHPEFSSTPGNEVFGELAAEEVFRGMDRSTPVGLMDFLTVDFCRNVGDEEKGMELVRDAFHRCGLNIKTPTRDGLARVVERLAIAERMFRDASTVEKNRLRRLVLVKEAKW